MAIRAWTWSAARISCLMIALVASACQRPEAPPLPVPVASDQDSKPSAPGYFEDRTPGSGLDFTCRNGEEANLYSILESLGGGVALLDYDQDGWLDLFVTGGGYFAGEDRQQIQGYPGKLYRSRGPWQFQDVTAEAGLPVTGQFYNHGTAVGDYNNDGWPDLLVTGYGRLALYHNNKGRFEDVTERAGLRDKRPLHWSTSAAWADLNGDSWPDLFVVHYVDWSFQNNPRCPGYKFGQPQDVCPPERFAPLPSDLYWNNGDGTFTRARDAGILPGKGLGVVAADVSDDGKPDIYVANDGAANYLYLNRGDGKFDNVALSSGVAYDGEGHPNGSMGVDVADFDGSGRLSIFVANYENDLHCLYRNLGNTQFLCVSRPAGLGAIGLSFVAFGTGFLDFDRDGHEDLFISNGHVVRYPASGDRKQRPILFRNLRKPEDAPEKIRFADVSAHAGPYFQQRHLGRGVALGDLDNDGRTDLVISHLNAPVILLRNQVKNGHHWLGVKLRGQRNRDAVGARLTLEAGDQKQVKVIKGGGSYLSASDLRVIFGLGTADRIQRLTVRWPSGTEQTWSGTELGLDRHVVLTESVQAVVLPSPRQK